MKWDTKKMADTLSASHTYVDLKAMEKAFKQSLF